MACVLVLAALQLVPAPHALHIAPTRRGVTTQRASHRDVSMATRGNARADDATRRRLFQALAHNRQPAGAITDLQPLRNEHEFAQCIDAWGRSREWKRALETLADYSCWAEAEAHGWMIHLHLAQGDREINQMIKRCARLPACYLASVCLSIMLVLLNTV